MLRRLCGFRPTGRLHLGHWFAVLQPACKMDARILVADHHAPGISEVDVNESLQTLYRFGISHWLRQSTQFDARFYFSLLELASHGDLARMPQFKSSPPEKQTAQLLTYPVLMTHDVAGWDEVVVGEDQIVHLEYAARLLKKHNRVHKADLKIPKPVMVVGRVKDLRDSSQKMSKSSPKGCLFLDDTESEIRKKIKAAVTDADGLANLKFLYGEFLLGEPPEKNSELKDRLAAGLIARLNHARGR